MFDTWVNPATGFWPPSATVVSTEPFLHGTGTLWCLQKEMATYRQGSVSRHCRILPSDKTEWWFISATLCRWRRCFVADQLWVMTCIREEEEVYQYGNLTTYAAVHLTVLWYCCSTGEVPFSSSAISRRHTIWRGRMLLSDKQWLFWLATAAGITRQTVGLQHVRTEFRKKY